MSGAAAIPFVAAIEPSKLMVAFPDVVIVTTSVIAKGLLVVVELVPEADQGSPEAFSVFNNVSVPNIVLEFEIYVFREMELTPVLKLPVNFDKNPVNPSGVVRPVADAMMVRVPAVVVLTS